MLKTLLFKQSLKWVLPYILPTPAKCFMYVFIVIAAVWASIAGYYYFSEDFLHFYGALVSGSIFAGLALVSFVWDYYSAKSGSEDNILNETISKNSVLIETLYDIAKKYYNDKPSKGALLFFVPLAIGIYLFIRRKKI